MKIATFEIGEEKTEFFLKQCSIYLKAKPCFLPLFFWRWLLKRFVLITSKEELDSPGKIRVTWIEYEEGGKTKLSVQDVKWEKQDLCTSP